MKKRTIILSTLIFSVLILAVSACTQPKATDPALYERDATENDRVYSKTHAVYDGSYRSMLTEDEKRLYDALVQNVLVDNELSFSVDISDMGFVVAEADQAEYLGNMAAYAFFEDHPEEYWFFWPTVNVHIGAQYINTLHYTISSSYSGARREREIIQNGIDAAVSEIRATRESESRYDTVKAIHDYVCGNLSYHFSDTYSYEQQTIAPIFGGGNIGKEAVCEGYAKSFKVLCDQFDIPAAVIGSRSHAFNYVQMEDGCYYAVDCTYDDEDPEWRYDYFLVGSRTVVNILSFMGEESPGIFNEDFDHTEYWYYFLAQYDFWPFVYPTVSEQAYSSIELLSEEPDPDKAYSGDVTFKFRYKGNDFYDQSATVSFNSIIVDNQTIDENGEFEVTYDTTLLCNGYNDLTITVGTSSFRRYINIQNPQIEILDWGDEIKAVTEPFEVRVKGYSTGNITDCQIVVSMDTWMHKYGGMSGFSPYGTYSFDKDGIASFVIDPEKCGEGLHNICVFFQRPGSHNIGTDIYKSESRSFRVSLTKADSGEMRFWGNSARSDRYVGEWADFTLKFDGTVTEKCQFAVTIDGVQATPLRQGGDKITDFFDKDGYCTFYLDVTGQSNGSHTVRATLTREDGSSVSAENTVNVTDGYFTYDIWKYNADNELVKYTDRNDVINGYIHFKVKNTSGEPGEKCSFTYCEDDMIVCDRMMTEELCETFWDDEPFAREVSEPYIHFGAHVMKIVFKTPDGTYIEKSLPFQVQAAPRYYDNLHFSVCNRNDVRRVGHTVDFTLNYDTVEMDCRELRILVDGKPADVKIPDDPESAFDHFGRFLFTLDFPDDQTGEHTVTAVMTKSDGAVMTAEQKVIVTDAYFEVTNWPEENPTLHRVYDVKVKRTFDTGDPSTVQYHASSIRQFIDGEYMGVGTFDKDGIATLGLNTAGLEKGEHLYKLVFCYNDGLTAESVMRFRVE